MNRQLEEKLARYFNNESTSNGRFKSYHLDNIKFILDKLGNPEKNLKFIHIAGTNGKGSTANFLNQLLMKDGIKSGLFTSPHLVEINERISIDNINISDDDLQKYVEKVENLLKGNSQIAPTFFDIITAIAISYFSDNGVEVVIMETGLGGRLDSTNIITPLVSIITDISLDHTSLLGNTLPEITVEKAGIIKNGIPVITSNSEESVVAIISDTASQMDSELFQLDRDFKLTNIKEGNKGYIFDLNFGDINLKNIFLPVEMEFQIYNFAMALVSLIIIQHKYDIKFNYRDLNLKEVEIPGRFELINQWPVIYYDPAHNIKAVSSLLDHLKNKYSSKKNIILFLTMMKDKEPTKILDYVLNNYNFNFYYLNIDDERSFQPDDGEYNIKIIEESQQSEVSEIIKSNKENSIFLFTGTFRIYTIAKEIAEDFSTL